MLSWRTAPEPWWSGQSSLPSRCAATAAAARCPPPLPEPQTRRWITAGPSVRRGPSTLPWPSPCLCAWCPAPRSLPQQRCQSKTRPGRELSEVLSRAPSPPPPAARPPRPVTSGPSGPAPQQAEDQSAEGAGSRGRGRAGAPGRAEGVPGRSRDWKEKQGACPPPHTLGPRLRDSSPPRVSGSDLSTPLFLNCAPWCLDLPLPPGERRSSPP